MGLDDGGVTGAASVEGRVQLGQRMPLFNEKNAPGGHVGLRGDVVNVGLGGAGQLLCHFDVKTVDAVDLAQELGAVQVAAQRLLRHFMRCGALRSIDALLVVRRDGDHRHSASARPIGGGGAGRPDSVRAV